MATEQNKDVEMKDADDKPLEETTSPEKSNKSKDLLTYEDIREQLKSVERGVTQKEPRFVNRAVRSLQSLRKRTNDSLLRKLVMIYYPPASPLRDPLLSFLEEPMEMGDEAPPTYRPRSSKLQSGSVLPELDVFVHLLILLRLIDSAQLDKAKVCTDALMDKLCAHNRRSVDLLSAKAYFYHSWVYESLGQLANIRSFLHSRLRTSTLHHDEEGQAVLINLLLRNYLHYNLYDQGDKLVSKSTFPDSANNNELARHLYYLGRIKATQLEYSAAYHHLLQAIRKAPQHSAVGFKQTAHKFVVVVQLLLGEIPDRATFRDPMLKKSLLPYFQLTQAVRNGDLIQFSKTLEFYGEQFQSEKTYSFIVRLRHNVIKTGIRMISLSYSRISLADIAEKLQLDSAEDAEYIVAKAIRDGVIEATIDHEQGFMRSKENIDIYATREPQEAFHQRVLFCLDLYTQSVKAMRYPPKAYRKDFESLEDRREREQQDIDLAKEIADDEDEEEFP